MKKYIFSFLFCLGMTSNIFAQNFPNQYTIYQTFIDMSNASGLAGQTYVPPPTFSRNVFIDKRVDFTFLPYTFSLVDENNVPVPISTNAL